jgi:hypothetical protein
MRSWTFRPQSSTTTKFFILNVNGVFCYFSMCAFFQGDQWEIGKNLDVSKLEIRVGVQNFLVRAFKHLYFVIWSYLLLEDVLQILPMLMPKTLVDQFVFVWDVQCIITMGQLTRLVYYYLKDLDWVHLALRGLLYGDKDQTLSINDEPSKALWNPKWSELFLEPFKVHELFKNKV